jgi:hypothetical protein
LEAMAHLNIAMALAGGGTTRPSCTTGARPDQWQLATRSPTRSGLVSRRCCPSIGQVAVAQPSTTVGCSTPLCGWLALARPGERCRSASGLGARSPRASTAGPQAGCGNSSWMGSSDAPTTRANWTGRGTWSTAQWCALTSTQPVQKGAVGPSARPLARGLLHEGPRPLRRARPSACLPPDRRRAARSDRVQDAARWLERQAPDQRASEVETGYIDCRPWLHRRARARRAEAPRH